MKNNIIILLLVLFTVNIFAQDAGIGDLDTGTSMADGDLLVATDVSAGYDKHWQASVVRSYILGSDIFLTTQNILMISGTLTTTSLVATGGNLNNVTIGSGTPTSGEFTSIRGSGSCEFNTVLPTGTTTTIGQTGDRWEDGFFDDLDTSSLIVGSVSNTEIQLLDGCENALIYQGGGNPNRSFTGTQTLTENDEGGHLLNSTSAFSITMPDQSKVPIMWGCMFTNISTGDVTLTDHASDTGFAFSDTGASQVGSSVTIGAGDTIYVMSTGQNGKWLIVSHFGCVINP